MPFHKITAHRIACLALYKAFLRHIPHLPFSNTVKKRARSKIYTQFRKDRRIQGLANIRGALQSAYEHETLFRNAATGDPPSIARLAEALKALKALNKANSAMSRAPSRPPPSFPPPLPPTLRKSRVMRVRAENGPIASARRRKAIEILRRRIPYITATSSLPLLRRPGRRQPLAVSMVLKKKIRKRQRRQDLADLLEDSIEVAKEEDIWDTRLWNAGLTGTSPWEERYEPEAVAALKGVKTRMRDVDKQALSLTMRFKQIIEKETVAKKRAIGEYKREKRKRARARAARKKKVMREYPQYFKEHGKLD
ncbi:hypothetical protein Q9L58_003555 [Maublancomyces gigas]|uniref:Complex 1 LYR protein domain-containing protein n=1 Tax=Discina gigas TaxID=1032678 RepID=A0ABR3GNI8_9PEZI